VYSPVPTEQIRPGSLGFFDGFGGWHSLSYDVKSVEWPVRPFEGDLQIVTHEPYGVQDLTSEGIENLTVGLGLSGRYIHIYYPEMELSPPVLFLQSPWEQISRVILVPRVPPSFNAALSFGNILQLESSTRKLGEGKMQNTSSKKKP